MGRLAITVVLLPSRDRTDWYVKRSVRRGDSVSHNLLSRGSLTYDLGQQAPRDVIRDLRRIAFDLERQYSPVAAEAAPEPPGGGYGGQLALPGLEPPNWVVLHDGRALDSTP
jgi:hypothetical protein